MACAEEDAARLLGWFTDLDRVVVAFSGGVDSAVVLAAALRALGPGRVEAATAVSASLAMSERHAAARLAARLGVAHRWVPTDELAVPAYRANGRDRCFHCKATLLDALGATAAVTGAAAICTGTNADDVRDPFRPGIAAAAQRGARTPLADLGLTKDRVRALARRWDLPVADKPATPCLASRIAYGTEVTEPLLRSVERAETAVRRLLLLRGRAPRQLRVRVLADRVRVEVEATDLPRLTDSPERLLRLLRRCGVDRHDVDLAQFRSGGLNLLSPTVAGQLPASRA